MTAQVRLSLYQLRTLRPKCGAECGQQQHRFHADSDAHTPSPVTLSFFTLSSLQGCHPDSTVYNALLGTCWVSGVSMAQMRGSLIWSAANRSGHFRVYHQAKSDPVGWDL